MKVSFKPFMGIMPKLRSHLLSKEFGTRSEDVELEHGALTPKFHNSLAANPAAITNRKTIYRFGKDRVDDFLWWFIWDKDIDLAIGPVVDDATEQTYYTGDGVPKYTNSVIGTDLNQSVSLPAQSYILGLNAPTKPTAAVSGAALDETSLATTVLVAISFVTADGEPGPPSAVSSPVDFRKGQTLDITDITGAPHADYNVAKVRIWVSQTASTGQTKLRFFADVDIGTATYSAPIDFTLLGEQVDEPSLIRPPETMLGMAAHPNGFLVGFDGQTLCRSAAFKPYGWPSLYRDPVGFDIVGIAIFRQMIVICTKGTTYLAIGQDPLNQSIVDLSGNYPCVSKRSIRVTTFGVIYASAAGLVLVTGNGPLILLTDELYSKEQWQAFKPESIHAITTNSEYILWYNNGPLSNTSTGSLVIDFTSTGAIRRLTTSTVKSVASYYDSRFGEVFIADPDSPTSIMKVGGDKATQTKRFYWSSKELRFDRPQNIGAVRITANTYPVLVTTFKIEDQEAVMSPRVETQIESFQVTDGQPTRLDGSRKYEAFRIEISSHYEVSEIEIASSVYDLRAEDG